MPPPTTSKHNTSADLASAAHKTKHGDQQFLSCREGLGVQNTYMLSARYIGAINEKHEEFKRSSGAERKTMVREWTKQQFKTYEDLSQCSTRMAKPEFRIPSRAVGCFSVRHF